MGNKRKVYAFQQSREPPKAAAWRAGHCADLDASRSASRAYAVVQAAANSRLVHVSGAGAVADLVAILGSRQHLHGQCISQALHHTVLPAVAAQQVEGSQILQACPS